MKKITKDCCIAILTGSIGIIGAVAGAGINSYWSYQKDINVAKLNNGYREYKDVQNMAGEFSSKNRELIQLLSLGESDTKKQLVLLKINELDVLVSRLILYCGTETGISIMDFMKETRIIALQKEGPKTDEERRKIADSLTRAMSEIRKELERYRAQTSLPTE